MRSLTQKFWFAASFLIASALAFDASGQLTTQPSELCTGSPCRNLWVAEDGDDGRDCSSEADACATIGRAVSIAVQRGDTINVKAGVYTEGQAGCTYFGVDAMACFDADGTEDDPIVLQSAPGHEGRVQIDGGTTFVGLNLRSHDYITVRNLEIVRMNVAGVVSGGPAVTSVDPNDESAFAVGVVVEGNHIRDVVSLNSGSNPGGVRMDNAKDWVVRNNLIDTVCGQPGEGGCRYTNSGCIYSYYIWNATIEHNVCRNSGTAVKWKDHIVGKDGNPAHFGSLVRYNVGFELLYGFLISSGNQEPEASNHTVTNNIFHSMDNGCMIVLPQIANGDQSINFVFNHNVCVAPLNGVASNSEFDDIRGNIFVNVLSIAGGTYAFNDDGTSEINASDYNVFAPELGHMRMARPTAAADYYTLPEWQAALASDNVPLQFDFPDTHSIEATIGDLFTDFVNRDFRLAPGSPAVDLLPNGDDAGAYQTGHEIIGLLPGHMTQGLLFADGFENGTSAWSAVVD